MGESQRIHGGGIGLGGVAGRLAFGFGDAQIAGLDAHGKGDFTDDGNRRRGQEMFGR